MSVSGKRREIRCSIAYSRRLNLVRFHLQKTLAVAFTHSTAAKTQATSEAQLYRPNTCITRRHFKEPVWQVLGSLCISIADLNSFRRVRFLIAIT